MADQRFIIEMGMGNDLHGENYTKAAMRAVENARQRSSLHLLGVPGVQRGALRIVVTIGVRAPEQVDRGIAFRLLLQPCLFEGFYRPVLRRPARDGQNRHSHSAADLDSRQLLGDLRVGPGGRRSTSRAGVRGGDRRRRRGVR